MNNNGITEVVFILDASGSMYHLTDDTIGGFNSMVEKQRSGEGQVLVSTVTFNDRHKTVHDRIDISEIGEMTKKDYIPGGSTALLDAMGDTIEHIEMIHKYIRKEDIPQKTLFVITTDGMENCSHKYSSIEIKRKVEAKKELGWEFIFMGANIDAVETAGMYGISKDMAVEYRACSADIKKNFHAVDRCMYEMRKEGKISNKWKELYVDDNTSQ